MSRRERKLAAGLRAGDPAALGEIHRDLGGIVFGFLRQALRDHGAAEDVFQQVFTEVWSRGAHYDPERASLLTWILVIARSRVIDELRRRIPEPVDPGLVPELAGEDGFYDDLLERWRIAHLLRLLPDEEAEVLRLRFYRELSQTEIAAETGIALGTVKTRMVRALERLHDLLRAEEPPRAAVVSTRPLSAGVLETGS